MPDWRFGRYFLLEEDVRSLFQWLNENIGDEWTVDVLGVCPNENKLVLNAVFGTEENLKLFQKKYIGDQSRYASVYNNRRKPNYKWPEKVERRSSTSDRRTDKTRRAPKRPESRRLEDIVKRALIRKESLASTEETVEHLKAS